jgi:hypothetical protein
VDSEKAKQRKGFTLLRATVEADVLVRDNGYLVTCTLQQRPPQHRHQSGIAAATATDDYLCSR